MIRRGILVMKALLFSPIGLLSIYNVNATFSKSSSLEL